MTQDEARRRIVEMMAQTFELEPAKITPESRLYEDLDLDSIDALDLVVKLQDLVHRRVTEDELRGLRTVGDVVALVTGGGARPLGGAEKVS